MQKGLSTRQTFLLLVAFAAILTASGFILQYGFHVIPCHMCWWQRYAHYGILGLSLVGLIAPARLKSPLLTTILLTSLAGLTIAAWQFAAQHGWLPFPASCTSDASQTFATADNLLESLNKTKIIPCDQETFTLLGLSLAGWNLPAMLLTAAMSAKALFQRP